MSNLDPTPAYPFGHGLSYTEFTYAELSLGSAEIPTDGEVEISCRVRNTGDVPGAEVVQLHTADPVAQLPRPVTQLTGFARVFLAPGEERHVTFRLVGCDGGAGPVAGNLSDFPGAPTDGYRPTASSRWAAEPSPRSRNAEISATNRSASSSQG